ncbi:MAG: hypothetical protein EOO01_28570, partial [Chitinophagaceae bacterium]
SIRLVKLNSREHKWIGTSYGNTEKMLSELLKRSTYKEWETMLPSSGDYERHSTEVKIEALEKGVYAVIISANSDFLQQENAISYTVFQVSSLSIIRNETENFVLNRKTGVPVPDVSIDVFRQDFRNNSQGTTLIRETTINPGKSGVFRYENQNHSYMVSRIMKGNDTLTVNGYFGTQVNRPEEPQIQTFFFTDRSIYRPGQTIFFKGIMLRKTEAGRENNVVSARSTEVTLYDVNGQKVASKKLITNEFGSFNGSFIAPEGVLTGNMNIRNENGGADFSVEEYKRPKFSVDFDTITREYALNDNVKLSGKALAYAGNNVDNAEVTYRVVRNTRYPYWWYAHRWGFPRSPEMEIANGKAKTDAGGNFEISFTAIPDAAVDPKSLPVFSYTVTADVTDINGETRSASKTVSLGYSSLQLSVNTPEQASPEDLDSINLLSLNMNDQFVPTNVQLRIVKLKEPENILRKRLWSKPDQFVIDSLSFKKDFPNDVYNDEDNHLKWPEQKEVLKS